MYRNNATGRGEKWPSRGRRGGEGGVKGTAKVPINARSCSASRNSVYIQKSRMRYSWNNLFRRGTLYLWHIFASFLYLFYLFFFLSLYYSPSFLSFFSSSRVDSPRGRIIVVRSLVTIGEDRKLWEESLSLDRWERCVFFYLVHFSSTFEYFKKVRYFWKYSLSFTRLMINERIFRVFRKTWLFFTFRDSVSRYVTFFRLVSLILHVLFPLTR